MELLGFKLKERKNILQGSPVNPNLIVHGPLITVCLFIVTIMLLQIDASEKLIIKVFFFHSSQGILVGG